MRIKTIFFSLEVWIIVLLLARAFVETSSQSQYRWYMCTLDITNSPIQILNSELWLSLS